MKIKEIMSKKPAFLPPTATLKQAADLMCKLDVGFIPVGENDRLIGAVTDRDIVVRALATGKDPAKLTVKEVMSKGIQFCHDVDSLEDVVQHMEKEQIRRMVVIDANKRMVGIVSLGDIATKAKNRALCCELTEAVSTH